MGRHKQQRPTLRSYYLIQKHIYLNYWYFVIKPAIKAGLDKTISWIKRND